MIEPYLILGSGAGLAALLWRRHRLEKSEHEASRHLARQKNIEAAKSRTENALRARISLEEKSRELANAAGQVRHLLRKAETHFSREEWRDAEKFLVRALALDEYNLEANRLLGLSYLHQGSWTRAEQVFEILISLAPEEASHFANLGLALYYQDKFEPAQEAYQKSIQLDDSKAARWVSLGQVRLKLADDPGAARAFEQAVERDKKNLEYRLALAEALELSGQKEAAVAQLREVLNLSPYHEEAQARLRELTGEEQPS